MLRTRRSWALRGLLGLLIATTAASAQVMAPSDEIAEKIIENYRTVNGGADAFEDLRTLFVRGQYKEGRSLYELKAYYQRPDQTRVEKWYRKMGRDVKLTLATDGEIAWQIDERKETPKFKILPSLKSMVEDQVFMVAKLANYDQLGWTLRYEGQARIGEREALKVRIFDERGQEMTLVYFDAKTFLPIRFREMSKLGNKEFPVDIQISRYERFDDFWIPREYTLLLNEQVYGWMRFRDVTINREFDPKLFEPKRRGNIVLRQADD